MTKQLIDIIVGAKVALDLVVEFVTGYQMMKYSSFLKLWREKTGKNYNLEPVYIWDPDTKFDRLSAVNLVDKEKDEAILSLNLKDNEKDTWEVITRQDLEQWQFESMLDLLRTNHKNRGPAKPTYYWFPVIDVNSMSEIGCLYFNEGKENYKLRIEFMSNAYGPAYYTQDELDRYKQRYVISKEFEDMMQLKEKYPGEVEYD